MRVDQKKLPEREEVKQAFFQIVQKDMPWKIVFLWVLVLGLTLFFGGKMAAQCDLEVDIKANPSEELCLGESVQLRGVTNIEVPIPEECGVTNDLNCGIGTENLTLSIGNGNQVNAENNSLPDLFGDIGESNIRTQLIYRAVDLRALGFEGGLITQLDIEVAQVSGDALIPNLSIKMGCTSTQEFSGSFYEGLHGVYNSQPYTLQEGWNTFVLDNAYEWDGISSIVVEFCAYMPVGQLANWKNYTRDSQLGYPAMRSAKSTVSTGDCGLSLNARQSNQRPNTRFNVCRPLSFDFTYNWTPAEMLDDPSSPFPTTSPTEDTWYYVEVFEEGNPGCVARDSVLITVIDPDNFTPGSNSPVCVGDALELHANTSADGYTWVGPDNFTSFVSDPVIANATLANAGTYTLFVDKGLCKATKTLDVVVEPVPRSGNADSEILCSNTESFDLFSLLSDYDQGGVWLDDDNSGILNGSIITPPAIPNNQLPVTFHYSYEIGNTCGSWKSTVTVHIDETPFAGIDNAILLCDDNPGESLVPLLGPDSDPGGTWVDPLNTGRLDANGFFNSNSTGDLSLEVYYMVIGLGLCPNDTAFIQVDVKENKPAGNGSTLRTCLGSDIQLTDGLQGIYAAGGIWTDESNSGATLNAQSGALNTSGATPGTHSFKYFIDNADPCPDNETIVTLELFAPPSIANTTTICSNDKTTYQVRFQIVNGDPSTYTVQPAGSLQNINGEYWYTSPSLPDGSENTFTVSDASTCSGNQITIRERCSCVTQVGNIDNTGSKLSCNGELLSVDYLGGFVSDGDDTLEYFLHSSSGNSLGVIFDRNFTGTFAFVNGMQYGLTYYISAVAGNKDVDGSVDITDECLDVTPGLPVVFREINKPTIEASAVRACKGDTVMFQASMDNGAVATWFGPNGFQHTGNELVLENLQFTQEGQYVLQADLFGCTAYDTVYLDLFNEPQINLGSDLEICNGASDSLRIQLSGAPSAIATLELSTGGSVQVPLQNGINYYPVQVLENTVYTLTGAIYGGGCSKMFNKQVEVKITEAPDLSYELISGDQICYNDLLTEPVVRFQLTGEPFATVTYLVNGFQITTPLTVTNGLTLVLPVLKDGENTFRVQKVTSDNGCDFSGGYPTLTYFNYVEPIVDIADIPEVVCLGDTLFVPVFVDAPRPLDMIYQLNGLTKSVILSADTVLSFVQSSDFSLNFIQVRYADFTGCAKIVDESFQVRVEHKIEFDLDIFNNSCPDDESGRVVVNTTDGGATFSLDGVNYRSDKQFEQLPNGAYTLFIKSSSGCLLNENVNIKSLSNLRLEAEIWPTTCGNDNGKLTLKVRDGISPYTITLEGDTIENDATVDNLLPGTYAAHVVDDLGCTIDSGLVIGSSTDLNFTYITNEPISCDEPVDGRVTVIAQGGSGTYEYEIHGREPQTDPEITGLFPRQYVLTVRDVQDGCSKTVNLDLKPAEPLLVSPTIIRPLVCHESRDAVIRMGAINATGDLIYKLGDAAFTSDPYFRNLGPGTHYWAIEEENGCRRQTEYDIPLNVPPPISLEVSQVNPPTCSDSEDGVIGLNATGGVGSPFRYTVNGGANYLTSQTFFNLSGDRNYTLIAKNTEGCTSDTLSLFMPQPEPFTFDLLSAHSEDGFTLEIKNVLPAGEAYSYSLDGDRYQVEPFFDGLESGIYTVYVMNERGCVQVQTINLSTTGILDSEGVSLRVYPNPFDNILVVEGEGIAVPELLDASGRSVPVSIEQVSLDKYRVHVTDIPSGIYILRSGEIRVKLTKQ